MTPRCRAVATHASTEAWLGASSPGNSSAAERGEAGQHPFFGGVLVADSAFLRDESRDRVGHRDLGAHRDAPCAGASGSRAHLASSPRDDFRYTPVDRTD